MRTKTPAQADKILTAAAGLFANRRFHEARMEDVAAAAAVGKGTLYRYFRDKEQLYLALLERAADQMSERLRRDVGQAAGPRARLEAMVTALVGYFDEHPHLFDLIQHAEAMQRPGVDFPWRKAREEAHALVRRICAEAEQAGAFAVPDPELAALLLLGGVRAVVRFGPRPRPHDLARRIVGPFLDGAAQPAGEGRPAWAGRRPAEPSPT